MTGGGAETGTLQRLVPDEVGEGDAAGRNSLLLHLGRYRFAARHVLPGRLLDMACGVGYGTRLLADECPSLDSALGVDLSPAVVEYARSRYGGGKASFEAEDAMSFRGGEPFDTIVSLETVEHLPDPERFADRLADLLRPGGVLVASVPVTPSVDAIPHHLHDFTCRSFRRLFASRGFAERDFLLQVQPFSPFAVAGRREGRFSGLRRGLPGWYLRHPGAFARRLWSTARHGFTNRYLTVAWRKER